MKCCMHFHSMIKMYFGKSQENLKKHFFSRASKLQQERLPPTDIFLRMALFEIIQALTYFLLMFIHDQ